VDQVERIAVSTLVKTGAKVAAALVGTSVFALVVFVLAFCIPIWLTVAFVGPQTGSSAAGLAFLVLPLAFVAATISWPVMGLYLWELFERMESQADLGTVGRVTLACVGSLVICVVVFTPATVGLFGSYDGNAPVLSPEKTFRYMPLAFCAFWSMLAVHVFRKLKSRA
jgi:hypothetical protein